jgi:hypothetical protein
MGRKSDFLNKSHNSCQQIWGIFSSRLEGAHAVLKRWIGGSSKDLTRVWEATKLAFEDQLNEIRIKSAQKLHSTPGCLSDRFYHQITGGITHTGLYLLHKQLEHVQRRRQREEEGVITAIYIRSFSISMGMPCWHMIKERLAASQGELILRSVTCAKLWFVYSNCAYWFLSLLVY